MRRPTSNWGEAANPLPSSGRPGVSSWVCGRNWWQLSSGCAHSRPEGPICLRPHGQHTVCRTLGGLGVSPAAGNQGTGVRGRGCQSSPLFHLPRSRASISPLLGHCSAFSASFRFRCLSEGDERGTARRKLRGEAFGVRGNEPSFLHIRGPARPSSALGKRSGRRVGRRELVSPGPSSL